MFRACCPNPSLSLRVPTIKNCNGRGVVISLYFMRLLRRFTPRNDILGFRMSEFDSGNTPFIGNNARFVVHNGYRILF